MSGIFSARIPERTYTEKFLRILSVCCPEVLPESPKKRPRFPCIPRNCIGKFCFRWQENPLYLSGTVKAPPRPIHEKSV